MEYHLASVVLDNAKSKKEQEKEKKNAWEEPPCDFFFSKGESTW